MKESKVVKPTKPTKSNKASKPKNQNPENPPKYTAEQIKELELKFGSNPF